MALDATRESETRACETDAFCSRFMQNPAYVNGVSESLIRGAVAPSGPYVSDEDVHYIVQPD